MQAKTAKFRTRREPLIAEAVGDWSFQGLFEKQIDGAVTRARLRPQHANWPAVKAKDNHKATSALNAQPLTHKEWEVRSGYHSADTECERLLGEVVEAERRIFRRPVYSFRDLRLKIDLASNDDWLPDEDGLRLVLLSVSVFADGAGRPDRRRDQDVEVGGP